MSDYSKWTVKNLRDYCRDQNIKIPSKSKKLDIIRLIENTSSVSKVENVYDPLTEHRQSIIKKVLETCKKDGARKILNFFKSREKNNRLKRVFIVYDLNLQNPSINEIHSCLKYYQEAYRAKYNDEEKLLINQMLTQPKYIDPKYVDPRLKEFTQFDVDSYTYDVPISEARVRRRLNEIKEK